MVKMEEVWCMRCVTSLNDYPKKGMRLYECEEGLKEAIGVVQATVGVISIT